MDNDKDLRYLKLKKAKVELEIAQQALIGIKTNHRPSHSLPVTIKLHGGQWMCLLETSDDLLECPVAYGSSPSQAMMNFDYLWYGAVPTIDVGDDDDDDDEDDLEDM